MQTTSEQSEILNYVLNNDGLVMVESVAGSGKTTLLTEIAKALKPKSGLYLAYNKSVATEAQSKFPKSVTCLTTHSLAYGPTVRDLKLKIGFLNYKQVQGIKLYYEDKMFVIDSIREYCLSKHIYFQDYVKAKHISPKIANAALQLLENMQNGKIDCTHDFYLKLFHIMLAEKQIEYDEFDFIALDEAGDLNPVTLEIFNLLPAKKKIMVGDSYQNIYGFNHTINCFSEMRGKGHQMFMTQSFRVSDKIAKKIERFCQKYINPNMKFKGIKLEDDTIKTKAFIARANATLIDRMMRLNTLGIQYGLTRTAKQIFELPLAVISFKHKGFISVPGYKFLQSDIDEFYESPDLQSEYKSLFAYLLQMYPDDVQLQSAINLVLAHGPKEIVACYEEARKHEKQTQNYMLGTSHSTKGLEFDSVEIADDLNSKVEDIQESVAMRDDPELTEAERAIMNLYYVACSRSRKELINATCL